MGASSPPPLSWRIVETDDAKTLTRDREFSGEGQPGIEAIGGGQRCRRKLARWRSDANRRDGSWPPSLRHGCSRDSLEPFTSGAGQALTLRWQTAERESTRAYKVVDAFSSKPFLGNPVAVVLDAEGLATAEMQAIARWTNLSETTFLLPPTSSEADYRLRIFTPRSELPFAGHPTLGSAHAVLEAGRVMPRGGRLVQECGVGLVRIAVEGDGAEQASDACVAAGEGHGSFSRRRRRIGGSHRASDRSRGGSSDRGCRGRLGRRATCRRGQCARADAGLPALGCLREAARCDRALAFWPSR